MGLLVKALIKTFYLENQCFQNNGAFLLLLDTIGVFTKAYMEWDLLA